MSPSTIHPTINAALAAHLPGVSIDPSTLSPASPYCARLEQDLAAANAERTRYLDLLLSRHGGEPLALLDELDKARAQRDMLRTALAHALAFLEHTHAHFDDPISEIDAFVESSDGGKEMECNLALMRDALEATR